LKWGSKHRRAKWLGVLLPNGKDFLGQNLFFPNIANLEKIEHMEQNESLLSYWPGRKTQETHQIGSYNRFVADEILFGNKKELLRNTIRYSDKVQMKIETG